jgi:hypothetical protein
MAALPWKKGTTFGFANGKPGSRTNGFVLQDCSVFDAYTSV